MYGPGSRPDLMMDQRRPTAPRCLREHPPPVLVGRDIPNVTHLTKDGFALDPLNVLHGLIRGLPTDVIGDVHFGVPITFHAVAAQFSFLSNVIQEPGTWSTFGRDFVKRAWPRESRYQTTSVARQFAFLAEQSGKDFPDVVQTILPLVIPTEQLDLTAHRAAEHGEASLARLYPESMLQLLDRLVPDVPRAIPYDLGGVLAFIAETSPLLRSDHRWRRLKRIADRG